jgi:predicted DNA repair protein MutK
LAGTSLLALLDDIATVLDDIAVMTKVAAKKTTGLLGDDLALNAEQVTGVRADRELPVVWAVAKGSFINKLILVPAALGISAVIPWLITPLLMAGGLFLCFEGFEKIAHKFLHPGEKEKQHAEKLKAVVDPTVDLVAFEKKKIKGAIRTDFILSAEIIVIALGTVREAPFFERAAVVSIIALLMTVGVYLLVAGIVKLDDLGLHLVRTGRDDAEPGLRLRMGKLILRLAPYMMKTLTVVGTAAMFLVGGGILMHGLPGAHHLVEWGVATAREASGLLAALTPVLMNAVAGIIAGALTLPMVKFALGIAARFKRAG